MLTELTGMPFEKEVVAILPFLVPILLTLLLSVFFPSLVTYLPDVTHWARCCGERNAWFGNWHYLGAERRCSLRRRTKGGSGTRRRRAWLISTYFHFSA